MGSGERHDLDRMLRQIEAADGHAERLRKRLDEALLISPSGYAAVLAAVDWHEAAGTPVPAAQLRGQAARRMGRIRPGEPLTDAEHSDGLAWAMSDPALLVEVDAGRYGLTLGLYRALTISGWSAPESLATATPLEAVALGRNSARHDPELAMRAWRQAAQSGDPDAASLALWCAADAEREGGRATEAEPLLHRLVTEGHFETAPRAMFALAQTLMATDPAGARSLLERAVGAAHPTVTADAAALLFALCADTGDDDGAIVACRIAYETAAFTDAPRYGLALAAMLIRDGDTDQAEQVIGGVIELDNPIFTYQAVAQLAALRVQRGDIDGAKDALFEAMDTELLHRADLGLALAEIHLLAEETDRAAEVLAAVRSGPLPLRPEQLANTAMLEARLAIARADDEEASLRFAEALHHPDPEVRRAAGDHARALGDRLCTSGHCNIPGAEPLLRHLMAQEEPAMRAWAGYSIGRIAERTGRLEVAADAFRTVMSESGTSRHGLLSALRLAELSADEGGLDHVLEAYLRVLEGDDPDENIAAAVLPAGRLAQYLGRSDVLERVRGACLRHARQGGPLAGRIAFALGMLEYDVLGRPYAAVPAWEIAAESGDLDVAPLASFNLGLQQSRWRAPLSAARSFERAIATGPADLVARATYALGQLADDEDDLGVATESFLRCLELGDAEIAARAAFHLADLVRDYAWDDAEAALHELIASSTAPRPLVGAAYAELGRLYAENGNRRLARRYWNRGRRHADPEVAAAFTDHRASIGRVYGPRHR